MSAQGPTPPVAVVGGGSFGRGIALAAARAGNDAILWSRSARETGHPRVRATQDLAEVARAEPIFVAVPSPHVAEVAGELGQHLDGRHLLVHVSRGLVGDDLRTITRVMREVTPVRRVGALAGPLVAQALANGEPGGAIVGTSFPEIADAVRRAIAGPTLRIYTTDDVIGVEFASAAVGMVALAVGFGQGLGIGSSALAVLATRGMAECARIGALLGARDRTFGGLAGYGDLLSAAFGDDRPELKLGHALARGASLEQAGREAGAYIEGVTIAKRIAQYAARLKLDAPIARTTAAVLEGGLAPDKAIAELMSRRVLSE